VATHASRNTTTGTVYENLIKEVLTENNVENFHEQVVIGSKRNGGVHIVDFMIDGDVEYLPRRKRPISKHNGGVLISLKNQDVSGTAEEKVPFECMKLQDAIDDYGYDSAIIVLNGNGWTWKDEYLSERFHDRIKLMAPDVSLMSHENFINYLNVIHAISFT
jgi:hypothetical protein